MVVRDIEPYLERQRQIWAGTWGPNVANTLVSRARMLIAAEPWISIDDACRRVDRERAASTEENYLDEDFVWSRWG
ncbi:MAG: hypothetical protein S0880_16095 [Actinomycetota bacterium]|nr:hypothetical protein [Actinomycetota bacterium]